MVIDIKTLNLEQLKALAYDTIATIELNQNYLQAINNEIVLRNQSLDVKVPEVPKEG